MVFSAPSKIHGPSAPSVGAFGTGSSSSLFCESNELLVKDRGSTNTCELFSCIFWGVGFNFTHGPWLFLMNQRVRETKNLEEKRISHVEKKHHGT